MKGTMRFLVIVAFVLGASVQSGISAQEPTSEDELALLEELMQILDEETTVATKTKLNSDYVPGRSPSTGVRVLVVSVF